MMMLLAAGYFNRCRLSRHHRQKWSCAGAPVEADVGGVQVPIGWGSGRSRGRHPQLRQPAATTDAVGAGYSGGCYRRKAAESDAVGGADRRHSERMGEAAEGFLVGCRLT